jgi:hypothetical protein
LPFVKRFALHQTAAEHDSASAAPLPSQGAQQAASAFATALLPPNHFDTVGKAVVAELSATPNHGTVFPQPHYQFDHRVHTLLD